MKMRAMGGLSALAEYPGNKGGQAAQGTRNRRHPYFNRLIDTQEITETRSR